MVDWVFESDSPDVLSCVSVFRSLCTPMGLQAIAQGRDRRERTLGQLA